MEEEVIQLLKEWQRNEMKFNAFDLQIAAIKSGREEGVQLNKKLESANKEQIYIIIPSLFLYFQPL